MDALDALLFLARMSPFVVLAAVSIYVGYLAYGASLARECASIAPAPQDHVAELERLNTEIARSATLARQTLEQARDAVRRGTR